MPRCEKCHSQFATLFRCPHCERKFPCPNRLFLISFSILVALAVLIFLFSNFSEKIDEWRAVSEQDAAQTKSPQGTMR